MSPSYSRTELAALLFALVVAAGMGVHQWWFPSSLYDAWQYRTMGRNLLDHGLLSPFMAPSRVRTYGYPLFLGGIQLAADTVHLPSMLLLYLTQAGLFLAACLGLRRALHYLSPAVATATFCGLLCDFYALAYVPEPLTESLSTTMLIGLAVNWLGASRRGASMRQLVAGGLLAGGAVAIRPANLSLAAAWLAGVALLAYRGRLRAMTPVVGAAVVVASMAIPLVPQLAYNVHWFGRWTPLVAQSLGKQQQIWGLEDIKYATAMPPNPEAAIHYRNPWLAGTVIDEAAPLAWYGAHPRRGVLTIAAHSFAMIDQDLLFTYSRDLAPWYRVPLGVVNHAVVMLGLVGLVLGTRAARRARDIERRDAWTVLLVTLAASWIMHSWTAVEMRFGFALLCGLFASAAYTVHWMIRRQHTRANACIALLIVLYVPSALWVSAWMRAQSPQIRAATTGATRSSLDVQPSARLLD